MSMLFKRIKDWATSITAFRTGDVIPVDGPNGTAKMGKDDLLRETAENAVDTNEQIIAGFDNVTFSTAGLKVTKMIKKINFYTPDNDGGRFNIYHVTLVNSNQTLQITLAYGNAYFDYQANASEQTGIKHYVMMRTNNLLSNDILEITFDWNEYESILYGTDLYVLSKYFGYEVIGGGNGDLQQVRSSILVPRRKVEKDGLVTKIYFKSDVSGTAKILVGTVSSDLAFWVRDRYDLSIESSSNYIDVSSLGIKVNKGDYVGIQTPGARYFVEGTGSPDNRYAFYYGWTESQLEYYQSSGKFAIFDFAYAVDETYQEQINSIDKSIEVQDIKELTQFCNSIGFSKPYTTNKGKTLVSFIKKINFYDSDNVGQEYQFYIISLISNNSILQITLSHNGYFDFKVNVEDRTGIKDYILQCDNKVICCTIDWDNYSNVSHISDLFIESRSFDELAYGNTTTGNSYNNHKILMVPCKAIDSDCKITTIYFKSRIAGTVKICVGEVDQLLKFNSFSETEIEVIAGDNYIDVSNLDIYAKRGNYIGLITVQDFTFNTESGYPTDSKSFYYSVQGNLYQLQIYGISSQRIVMRFGYTYDISDNALIGSKINSVNLDNKGLEEQVKIISSNIGFAYDSNGNKYKTRVIDGFVKAISLNFKHLLIVGNSYTVHPTNTDAGGLHSSYWWGHWSMAATKKETAWTTLLENNLKARDSSSTVQPVFGRTYEINGGIDSNDSFVYWDENNVKQSLYQNVSDFSNTDCIIFFLGDNYSGNDWYSRYKTMVERFESLFPNAMIFCMSTRRSISCNTDIIRVATEKDLSYIDVYNVAAVSSLGTYVSGDDGNLHQITNGGVANHPSDYGQKDLVEIVSEAINVNDISQFYNITITNANLRIDNNQRQQGAVVSIFGTDDVTSITVTQGSTPVTVTPHLGTDYGNIFTFIMPAGNVEIS